MPRFPTYEQQTTPGATLNVRTLDTGSDAIVRGLDSVAGGILSNAIALQRGKEQDAAASAALTVAKAKADWLRNLEERKLAAQPGAPDFTKTLDADYQKYLAEAVAAGRTPLAQNFIKTRLAEFGGEMAVDAMHFEHEARAVQRKQHATEAIETAGTAAEIEPDKWLTMLGEQKAILDAMDLTPIERQAYGEALESSVMGRAAVGYARRDPTGTLRRLVQPEPGDTLFTKLPAKARDMVLNEAEAQQRIAWQAEDRAYTVAKRREADLNEAASKDGDRALAEGRLSAQWIEANRGRLSPQDYRYFYRELNSGGAAGGRRALEVYADLRERASLGEDVRADARTALTDGAIEKADYDRLLGEVESSRPNWYKRGAQYLSTISGYSDLNPNPGAAQTKAELLDDWAEWARANPKATDAEAGDAYQRIASEYALIDTKRMTLTMRAPRFLVGTRNAPDIDSTEARTVEAFKAGQIDEAEFKRQAELLKEWRQALEPAQRTKP